MTYNLCDMCFHNIGYENEDTVICDRIWICYVKVKEECKYFKHKFNIGDDD